MTDDIRLEEIRVDTRFDTASPTNDSPSTQETPKSKGFLSTKKGKTILFVIIGIVIIGIAIGVVVALKKPNCETNCTPNPEPDPSPDVEININHKVNEVLIYDDNYEKKTNVVLGISNNGNNRRLDESSNTISQTTKYTTKYLINVYQVDEEKVYYAYAAIIKMNKKIEQRNEEKLGGNDIRTNNNIGDDVPAVKFSFDKDGNILSFKVAPKINNTLAAYLYEFVQKAIPQISAESFNTRRLEKGQERSYNKPNDNETIITEDRKDEGENPFSSTWTTHVKKGKVQKIDETKKSYLINDNSLQMDLSINNNNFTSDVQNDTNANRNSIVKKIITEINSELILSETETKDEDAETTKFINSVLNQINFVDYEKKTRRLEIIPNKFTKLEQLRELETVEIETYAMPIYFTYPLFRSNFLGGKVGLSATVAFYPLVGEFSAQMQFYSNGETQSIFKETKQTNFNEIIDSIIAITQNVYLVIKDNIENKILSHYQTSQTNLNNELKNLYSYLDNYPIFNNIFNDELQNILDFVNQTTSNCYNAAKDNSYWSTDYLRILKENIENGNEYTISEIINKISISIDTFVSENSQQIKNLYNDWKSFYNRVLAEIPKLKNYISNQHGNVETGVYYDIKDGISKITKIYSQFNEKLKQAIEIEKIQYKIYNNKQYYEHIDPILRNAETVAEYATNNASVIDAMYIYWENHGYNGTFEREDMIRQINELRATIVTINNLVYQKINNVFDSKLNGNVFNSLLDEVNNYYEEIKIDLNTLSTQLQTLNKYDVNFTEYFEDMKLLDNIEKEINDIKKESYKTYILDYLNSLNVEVLDNNSLKEIKNKIHSFLKEIKILILDNHIDRALTDSYSFSDLINEINSQYLGKNLLTKINQTYGNEDSLKTMLSNYFSVVTEAFTKFNTSFMDTNYLNHNYTTKPTELVQKLLDISYTLAPINSHFFENIQTLILNKIYYKLYDANVLVIEIIEKEYYEFVKGLDDKLNENDDYKAILENIQSYKKKYYDGYNNLIPITLYPLTKEDEFGIKETIEDYISIIRYNIKVITDKINKDFKDYYCYGNEIICFTDSSVSSIDHYFYQAAKLRTAISSLDSIIEIAESMIDDNVLSDLSSDDFKKEFEKELNYRAYDILEDIKNYLSELNEETRKYIDESIIDLKTDIRSAFSNGINLEGLLSKIDLIAKNTLVDPITLSKQIIDYLYSTCGPISKLEVAFNAEILANEIESTKLYRFDERQYRESYENALKNMNEKYKELKKNVLDDIKVPSIIIDDLKKRIKEFIEESYEEVLENINTISDVTEFEFLNMTYSLKDISLQALQKEKNDLINDFDKNISSLYNQYLTDIFKKEVLSNIETQYKTILKVLELEVNTTANRYNLNQTINNYGKVIDSLGEDTIQEMDQVVELFFEKIKDVYTQKAIDEELYYNQYYVIKEYYPFEANFENFTFIISQDINEIIKLTNLRYLQEQRLFLSNIRGFFVDGFKRIANTFINDKGTKYLENLYTYDYQSNIYDDFNLLKTSIIDITQSILMLLSTEELKGLGYTLLISLKPSLDNIRQNINKIIIDKVTDNIYPKIDIFKSDSISKIVNLFVVTLKKDNNLLEDFLDDKIYNLVPKTFNDSFAAELEAIFDELISKKTDEMKNYYDSKINEDLSKIVSTLNDNGKRAQDAIAGIVGLKMDINWIYLQRASENISDSIKSFDDSFTFDLTKENEINITQMYNGDIINSIRSIKTGFDYQVWLGQYYLTYYLNDFDVNDKVGELINNLTDYYFINNINNVKINLIAEFSSLRRNILNEFNDFNTLLEKESERYKTVGFDEKRRNLDESYNLTEIENALKIIDEEYDKFKKNVSTSNSISEIITKKRGFITSLTNSASTLTYNFYAYQVLISQYTNFETVEKFFNNLENQSLRIKQSVSEYITEHTNLIDDTLQTINNQLISTKKNINRGINNKINEALDYVFKNKFSQLINLEDSLPVDTNLNFSIGRIIYYDSKEEIVQTVDLTLNGIDATYSYKLEKKNDFDFLMDINTYGRVNLTATINVDNFVTEQIVGIVSQQTIGIQSDYNLHDRSLDVNGYVRPEKTTYRHIVRQLDGFGYPQGLFEIIESTPDTPYNMTKSYKKRVW